MANPPIPGFHFDPKSKRYFKILPNHENGFINQNSLQKNKESNEWMKEPQELQNIITVINAHQSGRINSIIHKKLSLRTRVKKIKFHDVIKFDKMSTRNLLMSNENVPFIIGTWESHLLFRIEHSINKDKEGFNYNIKSLIGTTRPSPVITFAAALSKAAENEYLVLKLNESMSNFRNLYFTEFYNLHLNSKEFYTKGTSIISSHTSTTIWSCTVNANSRRIALGAEKEIRLFGYADNYRQNIKTPGNNNQALCFNHKGNAVYAGTHSGKVCVYDLRSKTKPHVYPAHRGVLYLKLLKNEHSIIVSCLDDYLAMHDARMSGFVMKYPNHQTLGASPYPFSVIEKENLLCSVQKHGGVRVWSLCSGDLLAQLPPTQPSAVATATCFWNESHPFPILLTAPHSSDRLSLYTLRPS